jgi:hypothetical protein
MGDTNRVQIRYIEESGWGTTPATAALQELRWTGESLNYAIANIRSNEIRTDRQITDLVQTGAEAGGGIEFELSYDAYNTFMEGALWSTWTSDLGVSADTTIAADVDGFTSGASVLENAATGMWIYITGFSNGTIDGYYKVLTSNASNDITTSPVPPATEGTGQGIDVVGAYLRNGTTENSYSIEKKYADLSPIVYEVFAGMVVNSMNMSVAANSILTGSFEFIGKSATAGTGAMSSGSVTDATTKDVMNAVANVANIREDGSVVSSCLVQGIDLSLANNVRGLQAVGELGFCDIGVGQVEVTGTLTAYFKNKTLLDKYLAGTESSFDFRVGDTAGNAYIFEFPRVKFESDTHPADTANSDIIQTLGFTAIRDATYGYTFQVSKFAA